MSIEDVDEALVLPETQAADALLALPESQWFDRKSARIQPKRLAETLVAMGNAEGGTVAIGISDDEIQHVSDDRANALRQASVDFTQPPVRTRTEEIWISQPDRRRRLLIIRVLPGEVLHELTNGDCFLRVGDETRQLTHSQRQELFFDRSDSSYDSRTVPEVTLEDLDD